MNEFVIRFETFALRTDLRQKANAVRAANLSKGHSDKRVGRNDDGLRTEVF